MAGLDIVQSPTLVRGHYPAGSCSLEGSFAAQLASPPDGSLWLVRADLDPGTRVVWTGSHGDEAIFVQSGSLDLDVGRCPSGGAVIVEADVEAVATAVGPTSILHFGPRDVAPPTDGHFGAPKPGAHVHVIGPKGVFANADDAGDTRIYVDSTCESCRVQLFYVARTGDYVSAGHSHSQDELIHLISGEIHIGKRVAATGDTVAIPADLRYGFRSGPDGFGFLNYRRDVSLQSTKRGVAPRLEGGEAAGIPRVNDIIA